MDDESSPRQSDAGFLGLSGSEDGYEAALRAADAFFSGASARVADDGPVDGKGPDAEPLARGRVLRAIEAPPPVVEDHVETRKRRGRKPGSKNKPKDMSATRPSVVPHEEIVATMEAHAARRASPARPAPRPVPDRATPLRAVRPPAIVQPALLVHPVGTAAEPARRPEPFFWVRTKLKPGENWKRRLPKVIW